MLWIVVVGNGRRALEGVATCSRCLGVYRGPRVLQRLALLFSVVCSTYSSLLLECMLQLFIDVACTTHGHDYCVSAEHMSVKRSTYASCCLFAIHLLYVCVSLSFLLATVVFSQPFLFLLWLVDILPPLANHPKGFLFCSASNCCQSPNTPHRHPPLLIFCGVFFSFKTDSHML